VAEVRKDLVARDRIRGEFTLVVEAPAKSEARAVATETIAASLARIAAESGVDEKEAMKRLARQLGRSKSEIYRELQRERASKS
jgi:16S rRNA (cytidine1402-2'-O)-methyltransferase